MFSNKAMTACQCLSTHCVGRNCVIKFDSFPMEIRQKTVFFINEKPYELQK